MATASNKTDYDKDLDALKADFDALRADIAGLVGRAKDDAASRAKAGYGTAREQTESAVEKAADEIKQHPFTGILIALGLGFLLGALIERR